MQLYFNNEKKERNNIYIIHSWYDFQGYEVRIIQFKKKHICYFNFLQKRNSSSRNLYPTI